MNRRAARSASAVEPRSKNTDRQSLAADRQIEQLKKELSNARLDTSWARRQAEAQSAQLVTARAQSAQLRTETHQESLNASIARREMAAQAEQLASARKQLEHLNGEVARTRFSQEVEHSACVLLAEKLVAAQNKVEQLSTRRTSRKSAAATETRRKQSQLERTWEQERLAKEYAAELEQHLQTMRATLDHANSEMTTMQRVIREKDAMLNDAHEHCWRLKAELERLTAGSSVSSARRQEPHAEPKRRRRTQDVEFPSDPAVNEQLTQIARRINVEPLRGQARRAAESVEQRRILLSTSAADAEQQYHDWLADLNAQGYRAEEDPLVAMKVQELQAEHEFASEQRLHGRHGRAQLLQPGTDLLRVALIWAMQARQLYIHDPPSHRPGLQAALQPTGAVAPTHSSSLNA